jgi:AcrR family transcriptional regulator
MSASDPRSPDDPRPLRERHKETTRGTILRALADIVSEGDVHSFTVQQVADRAGVAHRTVYRHFPSREALLEALAEWLDAELGRRGTPVFPRTLDELPEAAELVFELFDEYDAIVRALAITYAATGIRPPTRKARTEAFRRVIDTGMPHLSAEERQRFFVVSRALMNSQTWQFFHDHLGMDGAESGRAVSWAIRTLVAALGRQDAEAGQVEGAA